MYAGEDNANHANYKVVPETSEKVFDDKERSKEEYILGIESSFDESAASLVNSYGEVVANHQITQWEQWKDFDGVVPEIAKQGHEVNIPKVTSQALEQLGLKRGDKRLKAIAVTLGPGQEKSL